MRLLTPSGQALAELGWQGAASASLPYPHELASRCSERTDLGPHVVYAAWTVCCKEKSLTPQMKEALLILLVAVQWQLSQGHTFLSLEAGDVAEMLAMFGVADERGRDVYALVARWLDGDEHGCDTVVVMGAGTDGPTRLDDAIALAHRPMTAAVVDSKNKALYAARIFDDEQTLAREVVKRSRTDATPPAMQDTPFEHKGLTASNRLTSEQLAAVRHAMSRRLTLITGGPGTGKTSVVVSILRAFLERGHTPEEIAMAAPTGKAAARLGSAVRAQLDANDAKDQALLNRCPEPETIHRLLAYSPSQLRFRHGRGNPLPERLVIVDECSMVDIATMRLLLEAVRADAQVVLLGDADQLPSVEAGAAFRDLAQVVAPVRLTRSFRMDEASDEGKAVLATAASLRTGAALAAAKHRSRAADLTLSGVEWLDVDSASPEALEGLDRFFAEIWQRKQGHDLLEACEHTYAWTDGHFAATDAMRIRALLEAHAQRRMLCVTHGLATGTRRLNAHFARVLASRTSKRPSAVAFPAGTPLLVSKNDYASGLFNGDQGVAISAAWAHERRPTLRAAFFQPQTSSLTLHSLSANFEPAFVQTVHKAQGSEYDAVALVLPHKDTPLLTQELLYTAVTRSRRSVLIVGTEEMLKKGQHRRAQRRTWLAERAQSVSSAENGWPTACKDKET